MMSPTTSLGRPFSAESCARPVTSSRFMDRSPFFYSGDKKSGGRPTFQGARGRRRGRRPRRTITNTSRFGSTNRGPYPWVSSGERFGRRAVRSASGQVVSDVREEVRDLVLEKDLDDDQGEGDDGDD